MSEPAIELLHKNELPSWALNLLRTKHEVNDFKKVKNWNYSLTSPTGVTVRLKDGQEFDLFSGGI